jgi:hypothetical protein
MKGQFSPSLQRPKTIAGGADQRTRQRGGQTLALFLDRLVSIPWGITGSDYSLWSEISVGDLADDTAQL